MDVVCLVVHLLDFQIVITHNPLIQFTKRLVQTVHDHKDIGAGFTNGIQYNSRLPIMAYYNIPVPVRKRHHCDITHRNGNAAYPLDDHALNVRRAFILAYCPDYVSAFFFVKVARADILVFDIKGLHQLRDCHVSGSQSIRVCNNLEFPLLSAVDVHRGHS